MAEKLPVAVIGACGFGGRTVEALRQAAGVELVGISDRDTTAIDALGEQFGIPAYDDNRSLLAETQPAAVFLSVPPAAAPDIIAACAQRKIHVWKELPLARDLDEGLSMVRMMDAAGLKFAVGTQQRFAAGYSRARELISEGRLGEIFLARAHYMFNWGGELGWRGDAASSGGGALLELGYHPVDMLTWLIGVPDDVYGLSICGHRFAESDQALYDTDDTAAAILRYPAGCMATVVTTRQSGPMREKLSLHGSEGSLSVGQDTCVLRDVDGNVLDLPENPPAPLDVFRRQVESFTKAVATDAKRYECSGWENLLNLAVIEAIYLSARTGQTESPIKLLKARDLQPEDCLKLRPIE